MSHVVKEILDFPTSMCHFIKVIANIMWKINSDIYIYSYFKENSRLVLKGRLSNTIFCSFLWPNR